MVHFSSEILREIDTRNRKFIFGQRELPHIAQADPNLHVVKGRAGVKRGEHEGRVRVKVRLLLTKKEGASGSSTNLLISL